MNLYQPTITGSLSVSGSINISGSINVVGGGGTITGTASYATNALTASSADNFTVRNTLTAQTLVVQTITSSVIYSSGSNVFGNSAANTQVFTGSVYMNPGGLFVSSSGLVGIGNVIPAYTLDVTGTGRFTSTLLVSGAATFSSSVGIGTSTVPAKLTIYTGVGGAFPATSGTTQSNGLVARYKDTSNACIDYGTNGGSGGWLQVTNITDLSSAYPFLINPNGGNVGIGTSSPNGPLDVVGPLYGGLYTLSLYDSAAVAANIGGGIYFGGKYNSTTYTGWAGILGRKDNATSGEYGGYMAFYTRTNGSAPAERMRIGSDGSVSVLAGGSLDMLNGYIRLRNTASTATYGLFIQKAIWIGSGTDYSPAIAAETGYGIYTYTNGAVSPAGPYVSPGGTTWTNGSSDVRKKKNFETTQGLAEVLQIEPIKYHFNEDNDNSKKRLGFKAQNIQPLIPEMVLETGEFAEDGSPYLTVTPDYILPVLVKAIQEQQTQIEELKSQINK